MKHLLMEVPPEPDIFLPSISISFLGLKLEFSPNLLMPLEAAWHLHNPTNDHGYAQTNVTKRGGSNLQSIDLARKVVNAITDKKGSDIVVLDLRSVSLVADYFVICSGESERQVKAMVDEVIEQIKGEGVRPLSTEGNSSSGWLLLDYGSVVVHVFSPIMRSYYQLEKLWSDALVVVRIQ